MAIAVEAEARDLLTEMIAYLTGRNNHGSCGEAKILQAAGEIGH
ncbi:hypothetical protein [Bradyrhizobium sp. USDA 4451]